MLGLLHEFRQSLLVEIEAGIFPVVQQRQPASHTVAETILAGPVVQVAASLARTALTERKDELGRGENVTPLQRVGRGVGIDGGDDAQIAEVVHLKGEAEIAGPAEGAHEHLAAIFLHRTAEPYLKERRHLHGGARAQLRVHDFFAVPQTLRAHLHFFRPVTAELREVVSGTVEIEQGRSVSRQRDATLLVVRDVAPRFDDVLVFVGRVVQGDGQGVLVVAQHDVRLRAAVDRLRRRGDVIKVSGGIAVAVGDGDSRVEVALVASAATDFPVVLGGAAAGAHVGVAGHEGHVGVVTQFLAVVGLIEAPGAPHAEHQVGGVGRNADNFRFGSSDGRRRATGQQGGHQD